MTEYTSHLPQYPDFHKISQLCQNRITDKFETKGKNDWIYCDPPYFAVQIKNKHSELMDAGTLGNEELMKKACIDIINYAAFIIERIDRN